ncbi:MAG: hypothetical protein OSA92_13930, partial [Pirellulaceae bacterium]|nr:hypothetical protein [Pirellulaceae bacterium]
MKRFLTGGIAFVLVLTFVVSGSLVAQEKANKKTGVIAATTAKAKETVGKLRDRVKEAVKRDKAEKQEKADNKSAVKDKIAATTDKAKETVGKLRDRVKEAVK